jgi:RecJ-like exonuclease
MENLGEIIDMQSHYLKFAEAREFVNDLLGANMQAQKRIVEMLTPELKRLYEGVYKTAKKYAVVEDFGPYYLVSFDGEKGTQRGEYPAIGKSTNHIHRTFESELPKPIITMTYGPTFITLRISDAVKNFAISEFVDRIYDKMAHARVDGGGHEHAGSVKFIEYGKEEVISAFKDFVKEVAKKQ